MKKYASILLLVLSTFTLSWDRPRTRDDGALVAPDTEIVYRVYDGDTLLADMITTTEVIIAPGPGTHTYRVSALAEDAECWSKESTVVWLAPAVQGGGGCSMVPRS